MNKGLRMVSQFLGNVSEKVNTKLKNWGSILFSKSKVLSGVTLKNTIQRNRVQRVTGMSASIMFGLLALAIIIPLYNVSGTEDTEAASSYVPSTSSITFTSTRNKTTINLTPTSTTGTFVQSDTSNTSEVASFNVTTDNATGYTLGIASSTDTTSLTNGTDTLPTITNASSGITAATFNTSTYNDMWGYLPSKYNSTSNTGSSAKFYPMTTTTATIDETAAANSTANTYTIALGARVTMTKSSGTYTTPTGTAFILTAVGKPASYTISYNANGGSGAPTQQSSASYSQQSVTLSNTAPTRSNYNFLGWCTVATSDQASGTSGSTACANAGGTYYAAGGTFYIDETTPNVTTLYAMWELASVTITFATSNATGIVFNGTTYTNGQSVTIPGGTYSIYGTYASKYAWQSWSATAGSFGNSAYQNTTYTVTGPATITLTGQSVTLAMQNLSSSNCTTTARPVYDTRDNSVYWVQRLADGKCWMLDNLGLDLTNSTIVNNLSTSNTNLDTTALSYFKNGGGSTSDRYPTAAYTNWTSSYSYSQPMINASNKDKVLVSIDAPDTPDHTKGAYGLGQNKWGAYYNYCAASVGYYCYGNGTSAGVSSGDNSYDVCPAGWRMPTGNTSGEYNALYTNSTIGSNAANYRNALSTPLSGLFSSGSAYLQGSLGYFWSSTRSSNDIMYDLPVDSSYVDPTGSGYRYYGNSVRCVLDPTTLTINFDTGISGVIVKNSSPEGATVATVTASGTSVSNISVGSKYYLLPLYNSGYTFSNMTTSGGTKTAGDYGYYYYTIASGTNTVTISATTLGTTSSTNMQGLTDANCTPYPMAVKDTRDSEVYYVQRLADGKCWMLENLRLDLVAKKSSLTTSNTNVNSTSLSRLKSGGGSTSDQYATSGVITWPLSSSSSSYSYSVPWTTVSGNLNGNQGTWNSKTTVTGYGPGRNYVGAYYNYCAATAGSYCYGNGTSFGSPSGNASYDICPAGWHMPSTGSSNNVPGSYYYLYNTAYSANGTNFLVALSTPLSGNFVFGVANQGSYGSFWSSTLGGSNFMYRLYVNSSGAYPTNSDYRYYGYSVRCVVIPPTIADASYMQDVTPAMVYGTEEGATATLADSRDNQQYTIKKINGQLWMTKNLAIGCNGSGSSYGSSVSSKSLTSSSSNVSDTWSTPTALLSTSANSSPTSGYTTAAMQCSSTYGAWYNYAAATAGTITGSSNTTAAANDICPAGWHLPTGPNATSGTDINKLVGSTTSGWINPTTGLTAFSAVVGGFYHYGSLNSTDSGYWWSATASDAAYRYNLIYDSGEGKFLVDYYYYSRYEGFYVRCVRTS